jgi:hypothetical protein
MNEDARITILGGVPIGLLVFAAGVGCGCHAVTITGAAMAGAAVAVGLLLDVTLPEAGDDHLEAVEDGCGCVEMWEATSEQRED